MYSCTWHHVAQRVLQQEVLPSPNRPHEAYYILPLSRKSRNRLPINYRLARRCVYHAGEDSGTVTSSHLVSGKRMFQEPRDQGLWRDHDEVQHYTEETISPLSHRSDADFLQVLGVRVVEEQAVPHIDELSASCLSQPRVFLAREKLFGYDISEHTSVFHFMWPQTYKWIKLVYENFY